VAVVSGASNTAQAGAFGCFKVTADHINIRARPFSDAEVVGSVGKGAILEKRRLWCTWRGWWCAVRKGDLVGYADKNFVEKVPCP
jgi:hypothetical protein